MKTRDIVVIGASAGGLPALKSICGSLPNNFTGAVFIVLHIPAYAESRLQHILGNVTGLKVVQPADGEIVESGKIYVGVNDHHLILENDKVLVRRGPKENRFRPSIDALFRSASYVHGSRVIGILLSGLLNDGVSGLWTIKQHGGLVIVQDPEDAEQPQLPLNALEDVRADYVLSAEEIGRLLPALITEPAAQKNKLTKKQLERLRMEVIIATRDGAFEMGIMDLGEFTPFTCPECHGALVRLAEQKIIRYRCHTGHAYTASSLLAELSEVVEGQLWQSMRGLEEMNMLLSGISKHYDELNNHKAANLFFEKAKESAARARILHDSVLTQDQYSEDVRHEL